MWNCSRNSFRRYEEFVSFTKKRPLPCVAVLREERATIERGENTPPASLTAVPVSLTLFVIFCLQEFSTCVLGIHVSERRVDSTKTVTRAFCQ